MTKWLCRILSNTKCAKKYLVGLSLGQIWPVIPKTINSYLPNLFQNKITIQEGENLFSYIFTFRGKKHIKASDLVLSSYNLKSVTV